MKQLTCEMCGSTDLIKDGGVFVCQTCGCKYSVEEARKMMIEGTVDVRGTVQVDNSANVKKYLENAKRAMAKEDWDETEKYYNLVEQNDPDNIEAIFYSAYAKAKQTLIEEDIYKREAAFKVLANSISIIDDHFDASRGKENETAIKSMAADLAKMISSSFVFTEWKNNYGIVYKTNKAQTFQLFARLILSFKESVDHIAAVADDAYLHESLILLLKTAIATDHFNSKTLREILAQEQAVLNRVAYWAMPEHKEEKPRLYAEKRTLEEQIDAKLSDIMVAHSAYFQGVKFMMQLSGDPLMVFLEKEHARLQARVDELTQEYIKATNGGESFLKDIREAGEEVRAVEEILEDLKGKRDQLDKAEAEIAPLRKRLSEIQKRLTNPEGN